MGNGAVRNRCIHLKVDQFLHTIKMCIRDRIETLNLETGDIADYRTTAQGIELEVMDAEEKRLAMLYFRWDEVVPLLRGMYARQQDGFGQELSLIHI